MIVHYTPPDSIPIEDTPKQAYEREYYEICVEMTKLQQRLSKYRTDAIDELRAVREALRGMLT